MSPKKMSVLLILLALALAVMAGCGGAGDPATPAGPTTPPDPLAGWIEYSPPDNGFSARLPEEPAIEEQTVPTEAGDIKMVMYLIEDADGALMLSHNELPAVLADMVKSGDPAVIKSMLDGGRDGAMTNVAGTLTEEQDITIDGIPGRDIAFAVESSASPTGEAIEGRARIMITPSRLWQLMVLANQGAMDQDQVDAFFDSFAITSGQ